MTISILGCGWFGLPLATHLVALGHHVKGSTTTIEKLSVLRQQGIEPFQLDIQNPHPENLQNNSFFDCEVLIITMPPKSDDYPGIIHTIIEAAKTRKVKRILYISSTGVYGESNAVIDETAPPRPSTKAGRLILEAETVLDNDPEIGSIVLRFGGLIGPGRSPATFLKPGQIHPNGLAPVNLIHLDDCIGIATVLIEQGHQNLIVNGVSPHHPTRKTFYSAAAITYEKDLPFFVEEKQSWKIIDSRHLSPLLGYTFIVDDWFQWLTQVAPK